jgi:hypothetical protein
MKPPTFEHRHYEAVAAILARALAREQHNDSTAEALNDLVQDFVDAFRADNPKFQPDRFVQATRVVLNRIPADARFVGDDCR